MPNTPNVGTAYVAIRGDTSRLPGDVRRGAERLGREAGDSAGQQFNEAFERRLSRFRQRMAGAFHNAGRESGREFSSGFNSTAVRDLGATMQRSTRRLRGVFDRGGEESGRSFSRGFGRGISLDLGVFHLHFASVGQLFARLFPVAVALGDAIVGLSAQVVALASAMASAVSASAAFLPILASLAQGAVATVIGFQGFGDAVKDGGAALERLTPGARNAAVAVRGLREEWVELQSAVQARLFAGTADAIEQLGSRLLPVLQRRFEDTALVVNEFFREFADAAVSARNVTDLNVAMNSQNRILRSILGSVTPLASAFRDWLIPILPFAEDLAASIQRGAENLADFAEQGRRSGATTEFFERAFENAQNLLGSLRDLTVGVTNFFAAGERSGAGMLERLRELSSEFRAFSESAEGQEQFAQFFEFGRRVAERLGSALQALGDIFGPLIRIVNEFLEALGPLQPILEQIARIAGTGLRAIADALDAINGPLLTFIATALTLRRLNLASLFTRMAAPAALAAGSFRRLGGTFSSLGGAARVAGTALSGVVAALGGPIGLAIGGVVAGLSVLSSAFQANEQEVQEWFAAFEQEIGTLPISDQLDRLREKQRQLAIESANLSGIFDRDDAKEIALQQELIAEAIGQGERALAQERAQAIQTTAAMTGFTEEQVRAGLSAGQTTEQIEAQAEQLEKTAEAFGGLVSPTGEWNALMEGAGDVSRRVALGLDSANVSLDAWLDNLEQAQEAQRNFQDNLIEIVERGFPAVAQGLLDLAETDPAAAAQLGEQLAESQGEGFLERAREVMPAAQNEINQALAAESRGIIRIAQDLGDEYGRGLINHIIGEVDEGVVSVEDALKVVDLIEANPSVTLTKETFDQGVSDIEDGLDLLNESEASPLVSADIQPARDAINTVLTGIDQIFNSRADVTVGGRIEGWEADYSLVEQQRQQLDQAVATLGIHSNVGEWEGARTVVLEQLRELDSQIVIPSVLADASDFYQTFTITQEQLEQLDNYEAIPVADLDNDPLTRGYQVSLDDLRNLNQYLAEPDADLDIRALLRKAGVSERTLDELDATHAEPDVDADIRRALSAVDEITRDILGIPDKTADVGADVYGLGSVQSLFDAINSLYDRTVTVRVNRVGGNISQDQPFARGGIVYGETRARLGEGGFAEAVIPLERPLSQVDPSVRDMAALVRREASPGFQSGGIVGGRAVTVETGAIQVITPTRDPALVAETVLDNLAILASR